MDVSKRQICLIILACVLCAGLGSLLTAATITASPSVKRQGVLQKKQDVPTIKPTFVNSRAPAGTAVVYGIITGIDAGAGHETVTFKLAEWVLGDDNQEQAAIEDGTCDIEKAEQDSCVPGGFYLRKTQKTLTLPIAKNPQIKVMARGVGGYRVNAQGNIFLEDSTLAQLGSSVESDERFAFTPFILTTSAGKVISLQEQYLP